MNAKRIWGIVLTAIGGLGLLDVLRMLAFHGYFGERSLVNLIGSAVFVIPGVILLVLSREGIQRRTVLIKTELERVYKKCFQWLGLQGYDISEQVKNERIVAKTRKWNMTLSFEKTEEGTFLVAETSNQKGMEQFSQLLGILSLLNE